MNNRDVIVRVTQMVGTVVICVATQQAIVKIIKK